MRLTAILSFFALAFVPNPTVAAPVPAPQGYASYGSYAGAGAAEGAAAAPAPPRLYNTPTPSSRLTSATTWRTMIFPPCI